MEEFDHLEDLVIEHSEQVVIWLLKENPSILKRLLEWEADEAREHLAKFEEWINKQP